MVLNDKHNKIVVQCSNQIDDTQEINRKLDVRNFINAIREVNSKDSRRPDKIIDAKLVTNPKEDTQNEKNNDNDNS